MYRGNSSRIFPIILVLIIVAIAIAAVVSIGRAIFGGGSNQTVDTSEQALLDTSLSHSVRMTVRGPIVADENFRSYQITVDPTNRNLTIYSGYLKDTLNQKTLDNNTAAYAQFVHALDKANLAKGKPFEGDKDDTRGICATGAVYEFDIMDSGNSVKHLWTSTCSGSKGSLNASVTQVSDLFYAQIPNADQLLSNIDLGNNSNSLAL